MNKVVAFALTSICLALATHAQLSPLPPSSALDGIIVRSSGVNQSAWQSSNLADYQLATGNPFHTPTDNSGTDIYGRTWTNQAPGKSELNNHGGNLRLIFLGNVSNWDGAIGYSYSGSPASPADSFTVADTYLLNFGDHVDISMGAGTGSAFDLWATGGVNAFSLFEPSNSVPSSPNGSVSWTRSPLLVSTYLPALDVFQDVETWIVSVDENTGDPANPVLNYRVAVQFYYPEGSPFVMSPDQQTPVPEASTYGVAAGLALILLALRRRCPKI